MQLLIKYFHSFETLLLVLALAQDFGVAVFFDSCFAIPFARDGRVARLDLLLELPHRLLLFSSHVCVTAMLIFNSLECQSCRRRLMPDNHGSRTHVRSKSAVVPRCRVPVLTRRADGFAKYLTNKEKHIQTQVKPYMRDTPL